MKRTVVLAALLAAALVAPGPASAYFSGWVSRPGLHFYAAVPAAPVYYGAPPAYVVPGYYPPVYHAPAYYPPAYYPATPYAAPYGYPPPCYVPGVGYAPRIIGYTLPGRR